MMGWDGMGWGWKKEAEAKLLTAHCSLLCLLAKLAELGRGGRRKFVVLSILTRRPLLIQDLINSRVNWREESSGGGRLCERR